MGQEIVYCYWCSNRILGADFDKGAAVLIGNHACCPPCLPKVMASLPENQRQTVLNTLARDSSSAKLSRNTPRGGTEISSSKTPRAVPQLPPEAPRKIPLLPLAIGVGALVVVVALVVAFGSSSDAPARREPPPADPGPAPKADVPERDKSARAAIDKARDSARAGIDIDLQVRLWEEAVTKSERTTLLDEATQQRTLILARRKEVYAQDLAKLADSVDGAVRQAEYKNAIEMLTGALRRHEMPEWSNAIDQKLAEVRKAEISGAPFRQSAEADGIVSMEAERYHQKTDMGEHAWTLVTAPAGFSGTGAMAALPNKGKNWPANFAKTAAHMDFRVEFAKTGKHYIWIRGSAADGTDDSIHVGLDGQEIKALTCMVVPITKAWAWSTRSQTNAQSVFEVPSAGLHTINVWMREDGAILDKIVITTNSKYSPKEMGPPESPR